MTLLIGLLGGISMGAVAAARRTQSSFPRFLASTNPSDLTTIYNGRGGGYDARLAHTIAHLPHVEHAENMATVNAIQLSPDGVPVENGASNIVASVDGLFFDQDRPFVSSGRLPDPQRVDEAAATAEAVREFGLHLGSVISLGFYTNDQTNEPGFDPTKIKPYLRSTVTVVGIGVDRDSVVQDDSERSGGALLLTPALTRTLLRCCANGTFSGLQLDHGHRDVAVVETEIEQVLPPDTGYYIRDVSVGEAKAERAIKPESIALAVFGGIAALATLLIAGQVIGRQVRLGGEELDALRALGASPRMVKSDGLIGIAGAVFLGTLLAAAVAVALSPLAPIGPVRTVEPSPGIAFDWAVLGGGLLLLIVTSGAVVLALAHRRAPHGATLRFRPTGDQGSRLASVVAASGLPVAAVAGIRLALIPGVRGNAPPVRSAILGAALAVIVMTATLTFGSSLHMLVSHPALYGWNWDYALEPPGGGSNIDAQRAARLLDHNPDVSGWTGASFENLRIDGRTIPVLGVTTNAEVSPPLLSGHGLDAPDQIVLGTTTLAMLHKRVGDTVDANYATVTTVTRLRIVGTATMPAVGPSANQHVSMGTGALVSRDLIPGSGSSGGNPGPNIIFVRVRSGTNPAGGLRSLNRVADALFSPVAGPVAVLPVQRPAEIVNYGAMGTTPAILGGALAAGAVSALGLTLVASVRRRRRDLALFKTLGFTARQLAAVVAWQSSVVVAIGTFLGVPLGVALGRELWNLFAYSIGVVPAPSVPVLSVALVAFSSLALANIVAAIPGRLAARTPATLLLRAE